MRDDGGLSLRVTVGANSNVNVAVKRISLILYKEPGCRDSFKFFSFEDGSPGGES